MRRLFGQEGERAKERLQRQAAEAEASRRDGGAAKEAEDNTHPKTGAELPAAIELDKPIVAGRIVLNQSERGSTKEAKAIGREAKVFKREPGGSQQGASWRHTETVLDSKYISKTRPAEKDQDQSSTTMEQ